MLNILSQLITDFFRKTRFHSRPWRQLVSCLAWQLVLTLCLLRLNEHEPKRLHCYNDSQFLIQKFSLSEFSWKLSSCWAFQLHRYSSSLIAAKISFAPLSVVGKRLGKCSQPSTTHETLTPTSQISGTCLCPLVAQKSTLPFSWRTASVSVQNVCTYWQAGEPHIFLYEGCWGITDLLAACHHICYQTFWLYILFELRSQA